MPEALRRFVRALIPGRAACWLWLQPDGVVELRRPVANGPAPAAQPWADWCAAHPGAHCHLLVSSQLLSTMNVAPGLDLKALDEVADHARAQFVHYHGAAAQSWPVLPWQADTASGATALSGVDPAALRTSADKHGVQLLSLQPAWSAALRTSELPVEATGQWLLVLDEGRLLTAVACARGQPSQVLLRRCEAGSSDAVVSELMQELQLAATAKPQHLLVPDVLLHRRWRPPALRQQFVQQERHAPLAWTAAVCACLLAAVTGADAVAAWQRLQAARAAMETGPSSGLESRLATSDLAERPSEAQAALLASLATPWPAAFAAAEASTVAGVRWLGLELDGRQLRLDGTAGAMPVAWQAAGALAQQPGVSDSALTRVQSDAGLVRFELRAAWTSGGTADAASAPAR